MKQNTFVAYKSCPSQRTDTFSLNIHSKSIRKKVIPAATRGAIKDGVTPSDTVATGDSGNGTQSDQNTNDQDVGMSSSTAGPDAVKGNRSGVNAGPNSTTPNKGTSYANLFTGKSSRKSVNFRTLITPVGNGIDVAVPVVSIKAISERFVNTTYGFFLGKRVAYPVVSNYVRIT
nr:hypothetical protein [Tanacetum cinerariifolium]